jgi:hypothetical protein
MLLTGPSEKVFWGIIIVLVLGYLGGTWLNRRRSRALGQWLEGTLTRLGKKTAWKWVGTMTSGAVVTVTEAFKPFRQVEITYLLLTRELLPLWGIEMLRGKRDLLIVRGQMRGEPADEIEIVPIEGKLRKALDERAGDEPWHWEEAPAGLGIATRGTDGSRALGSSLKTFLGRYGQYVQRLSLRKRQPNLVLFVLLSGIEAAPAADFFGCLRDLASAHSSDEPGQGKK